jgi:hypothetical protein
MAPKTEGGRAWGPLEAEFHRKPPSEASEELSRNAVNKSLKWESETQGPVSLEGPQIGHFSLAQSGPRLYISSVRTAIDIVEAVRAGRQRV